MVEKSGEYKLILYNWLSDKVIDGCHHILILDSQQFESFQRYQSVMPNILSIGMSLNKTGYEREGFEGIVVYPSGIFLQKRPRQERIELTQQSLFCIG